MKERLPVSKMQSEAKVRCFLVLSDIKLNTTRKDMRLKCDGNLLELGVYFCNLMEVFLKARNLGVNSTFNRPLLFFFVLTINLP